MKAKASLLTAGVLMASLLAASPAVLADHHGKKHHASKADRQELCENMREGKGHYYSEERRAEMEKHRADMAARLQLNEDQREIWKEIHQERQQKHEERMGKWQQKMEKRCADMRE
ncbi:hypothetical protein [Marinobacter halophilus]|uniref:Zinc resistance-associated protein n=1 Tax=Marinobacter halophilus TaxID=1323740 RepID=A0A2T1KCY0_9GAMM|nr:hypothetical protein [Marinobacter halophilus]PSF07977.1 hypothetical protein C7H08_11310 [Marinobacter halophilus]GGC58708.1 hypothetical protein GCM10011362_03910 [Marinobacter halophilus]